MSEIFLNCGKFPKKNAKMREEEAAFFAAERRVSSAKHASRGGTPPGEKDPKGWGVAAT